MKTEKIDMKRRVVCEIATIIILITAWSVSFDSPDPTLMLYWLCRAGNPFVGSAAAKMDAPATLGTSMGPLLLFFCFLYVEGVVLNELTKEVAHISRYTDEESMSPNKRLINPRFSSLNRQIAALKATNVKIYSSKIFCACCHKIKTYSG